MPTFTSSRYSAFALASTGSASANLPTAAAAAFCLLLPLFTFSQPVYQKLIGSPGIDKAHHIVADTGGAFIISGQVVGAWYGADDIVLMKLDSNGNRLWTKVYGAFDQEFGHHFIRTADGGYMIAGNTESFGAGNDDYFLLRLSPDLEPLWSKVYGGYSMELGHSVHETFDGGFACVAASPSWGIGSQDWYVFRVDAAGNLLWSKALGSPNSEFCYWIEETSDSGLVAAGTYSPEAGTLDHYIVKFDRNGNILWARTIGGPAAESPHEVLETANGDLLVVGWTQSYGAGSLDGHVMRLDRDGSLLWSKTYGGGDFDQLESICPTKDGNYLLAGNTVSFGVADRDYLLIKIDGSGKVLWAKTYGSTGQDFCYTVAEKSDGSIVLAGETDFGGNVKDILVVQADSLGYVNCNTADVNVLVSDNAPAVSDTNLYFVLPDDSVTTAIMQDTAAVLKDSTICYCVPPLPAAAFTWTADSAGSAAFTDESAGATEWLWLFGNGDSSSLRNPVYSYPSTGTYYACLVARNECGPDTVCDTVAIYITDSPENEMPLYVEIFPNPASLSVHITIRGAVEKSTLVIRDMAGKAVAEEHDLSNGSHVVSTAGLLPGLYICQVKSNGIIGKTGKLLIAK